MKYGNISKKKLYEQFGTVNCNVADRIKLWVEMHIEGADETDFLLEFPAVSNVIQSTMTYWPRNKVKYTGGSFALAGSCVRLILPGGVECSMFPLRLGDIHRMVYVSSGWTNIDPRVSLRDVICADYIWRADRHTKLEIKDCEVFDKITPLRMSSPFGGLGGEAPLNYKVCALLMESVERQWRECPPGHRRNNMSTMRHILRYHADRSGYTSTLPSYFEDKTGDLIQVNAEQALIRALKVAGEALTDVLRVCDHLGEFPEGQLGETLQHINKFQSV
jgi:hypothetical protein